MLFRSFRAAGNGFTRPACSLDQYLARELLIVEPATDIEGCQPLSYTCDVSHALDTDIFRAVVGGRDQNFDANVHPDWRTSAAEDQRPIHRDIVCKAALRMFRHVHPVEDDGKAKLVSNSGSALSRQIKNGTVGHKRRQNNPVSLPGQSAECLKMK